MSAGLGEWKDYGPMAMVAGVLLAIVVIIIRWAGGFITAQAHAHREEMQELIKEQKEERQQWLASHAESTAAIRALTEAVKNNTKVVESLRQQWGENG